nr:MAG TPA: hypothetical protein [Caudoviricetes sp.]
MLCGNLLSLEVRWYGLTFLAMRFNTWAAIGLLKAVRLR